MIEVGRKDRISPKPTSIRLLSQILPMMGRFTAGTAGADKGRTELPAPFITFTNALVRHHTTCMTM